MCLSTRFYIFVVSMCLVYDKLAHASAVKSTWPQLKNFDIWGSQPRSVHQKLLPKYDDNTLIVNNTGYRDGKVPVEEECQSEDGRRSGVCLNVYDCHRQGGTSKGECALGFGACCVFTATCDQEIKNNITYIVSPGFPAIMQSNITSCKLKIRPISPEISQLRLDFVHFSLGQPNRANGVCDGDIFTLNSSTNGEFKLCGQNNGQHIYYDVIQSSKAKEEPIEVIEVLLSFSNNSFSSRLWEIKVSQIPFSQRAPAGCLQYFTGDMGVIQTFNFAENGRHLANQNYRICIRQEVKMCSIAYEPCSPNSFRIGGPYQSYPPLHGYPPNGYPLNGYPPGYPSNGYPPNGYPPNGYPPGYPANLYQQYPQYGQPINMLSDSQMQPTNNASNLNSAINPNDSNNTSNPSNPNNPTTTNPQNPVQNGASQGGGAPAAAAPADATPAETVNDPVSNDEDDVVEGSGEVRDEDEDFSFLAFFTRRSMRSMRESRQFYTLCVDRITMPCIVEDFLTLKSAPAMAATCSPVHCGNSLCPYNATPCRVESTVAPFGIGVHFGSGLNKGSPEENIGMCLRYIQMNCI